MRGIYFRRSIVVVVFCAKFAEFNFAILGSNRENVPRKLPAKISALKVLHEIICLDVENF